MAGLTTTLHAAAMRVVDQVIDKVAADGLSMLKTVLDDAGFNKSDHLKNYEIYSYVTGKTVTFEITIDSDAVVAADPKTKEMLNKQATEKAKSLAEQASRVYAMSGTGPVRIMFDKRDDARKPVNDARVPARDARKRSMGTEKNSVERMTVTPRGMKMTREGRLSITIQRAMEHDARGYTMPDGPAQGILGDYVKRMKDVISSDFGPELEKMVQRHFL